LSYAFSSLSLACCGLALAACGSPDKSAQCRSIANDYAVALAQAISCDPAAPNPCDAQRPLASYASPRAPPDAPEGLCDVANSGYVSSTGAANLDGVLSRYRAAGCQVGTCPGPAPHTVTCADRGSGSPTCG
jgi:hypothetical protein